MWPLGIDYYRGVNEQFSKLVPQGAVMKRNRGHTERSHPQQLHLTHLTWFY